MRDRDRQAPRRRRSRAMPSAWCPAFAFVDLDDEPPLRGGLARLTLDLVGLKPDNGR